MKMNIHAKPFTLFILLMMIVFATSACSSGAPSTPSGEEATALQEEMAAMQTRLQTLQDDLSKKESEQAALSQALSVKESELATLSQTVDQLEEDLAEAQASQVSNPPNPTPSTTASLLQTAMSVVQLLANNDMVGLSSHVHPTLGVRFTPYPYVNPNANVVLTIPQVASAISAPVQTNWGEQDGTGDPIVMDYATYHARYVYDQDYANPEVIGIDTVVGNGNMIDNLATVYPNARYVDFHFNGFDPQYDGMDWRSLRLVFELDNGDWKLVGIVHGEWTT